MKNLETLRHDKTDDVDRFLSDRQPLAYMHPDSLHVITDNLDLESDANKTITHVTIRQEKTKHDLADIGHRFQQ